MKYRNRRQSRRGVLLLVVLSLLIMFLLAGMTFIVVASSFKKDSVLISRDEQTGDSLPNVADSAMYQILRGTDNTESVFNAPVSLLEDVYGRDGFVGEVLGFAPVVERGSDDQFIQVNFQITKHTAANGPLLRNPLSNPKNQLVLDGFNNPIPILRAGTDYSGCVISLSSGVGANKSTRIVRFQPRLNLGVTNLLRLTRSSMTILQHDGLKLSVGDRFVVNGRAFNGSGVGFTEAGEISLGIRTQLPNNPTFIFDLPLCLAPNLRGMTATIRDLQSPQSSFPGPGIDTNGNVIVDKRDLTPFTATSFVAGFAGTMTPDIEHNIGLSNRLIPQIFAQVDESWDAADFQNMHLASIPHYLTDLTTGSPTFGLTLPLDNHPVLPSFHRPELVQYWMKKLYSLEPYASLPSKEFFYAFEYPYGYDLNNPGDDPNLPLEAKQMIHAIRRMIIMRPLREDNPQFTGSNPSYHSILSGWADSSAILNAWDITTPFDAASFANPLYDSTDPFSFSLAFDIDNDGDGFRDSIWLDAGLPTVRAKDGRLYRPLVAPLCVDLDSRVNINTAGRLAEFTAPVNQSGAASNWAALETDLDALIPDDIGGGSPLSARQLTFGRGFGPAEISLPHGSVNLAENLIKFRFGISTPMAFQSNQSLFAGDPNVQQRWLAERYSSMNTLPGGIARESLFTNFAPGPADLPGFGWTNQNDGAYSLWRLKYNVRKLQAATFRTPGDVHGRIAVALDHSGRPIYANFDNLNEFALSPYQINLLQENHYDTRFDEQDLERILRSWDHDVPTSRIASALQRPSILNSQQQEIQLDTLSQELAKAVTTRSFEVPSLPSINPADYNFTVGFAQDNTATTILAPLLRRKIVVDATNPLTIDEANALTLPDADTDATNNEELRQVQSIQDLFIARLLSKAVEHGGMVPPIRPVTLTDFEQLQVDIALMMPYEIARGQRFDLNRPFGDGIANDGLQIVDEESDPLTVTLGGSSFTIYGENGNPGDPSFMDAAGNLAVENLLNGNPILVEMARGSDQQREKVLPLVAPKRQAFARHLYCLMMFLLPAEYAYDVNSDGSTTLEEREMLARAIAQYAINVVDFRDMDSIMTPFEYDTNPYDGWDVSYNMTDDHDKEGIVWGMEQPELLMTEALAFHDRRTEDRPENGETTDDPADNFDQRLMPHSGFFLELYNAGTRTLTLPLIPSYGAETPAWRLVVAVPPPVAEPDRDPDDPHAPTGKEFNWSDVDRLIYFAEPPVTNPENLMHQGKPFFYHQNNQPLAELRPGRYAIVGGGQETAAGDYETYLGRVTGLPADLEVNGLKYDETRRIVLSPVQNETQHQVSVLSNDNTGFDLTDYQPAIAVNIDGWSKASVSNAATDRDIRPLSISDPPDGYENYVGRTINPFNSGTVGSENQEGAFTNVIDEPIDFERALLDPKWAALKNKGTTINFRTIYLQRLADPNRPWDLKDNPYRTVDRISTNLTAFNGLYPFGSTSANSEYIGKGGAAIAPDEQNNVSLITQQRGDAEAKLLNPLQTRSLWPIEPKHIVPPVAESTREAAGGTPHNFPFELRHTLGHLNQGYWRDGGTANVWATATSPRPEYVGMPNAESGSPVFSQTFPWMSWNDRPFTAATELLEVPYHRSSRVLDGYSYKGLLTNSGTEYDTDIGGVKLAGRSAPFGHLLGFFNASVQSSEKSQHFYRLLDFVEVRSPFAGAEKALTDNAFGVRNFYGATAGYRFPLNYVSRFRNPGQINLNTITNPQVWESIVASTASVPPRLTFDQIVKSVRGSADFGAVPGMKHIPLADYPTLFANPFRAAANANSMPNVSTGAEANTANDTVNMAKRTRGVDATLLRASTGTDAKPNANPLLRNSATTAFNNSDRNSAFRYQHLERLDSLTTTQSNVYALWLTVGYFEVNPETGQLGQEKGTDTGDIKRNRAFYIIDRSIPVAFEPGQNHNVDKCVVLRRMIE